MTSPTLFLPPPGASSTPRPEPVIEPLSVNNDVFDDVPRPDDAPRPGAELFCEVCGVDIAYRYSGKGRKPKYCETHAASRGSARTSTPAATGRATKDDKLVAALSEMLGFAGSMVTIVNAYDGLVVVDRAHPTAVALVALSQENKQVRDMLEKMVTVSVWSQVATALAGIALPIAANHGLLPIPQDAIEMSFLSESARREVPQYRSRNRRAAPPQQAPPQQYAPPSQPEPQADVDGFGKPMTPADNGHVPPDVVLDGFGKPLVV